MEQLELKQRSLFETRHFSITDAGIQMNTKKISANVTITKDFDQFTMLKRTFTESHPRLLRYGSMITILALIQVLSFSRELLPLACAALIVGISLLILYKVTMKTNMLYELDDDTQLFLLSNNPNKAAFDSFTKILDAKLAHHFRNKYFHAANADDNKPVVTLRTMRWLKEQGIISMAEYEEVKKKIVSGRATPIGFQA